MSTTTIHTGSKLQRALGTILHIAYNAYIIITLGSASAALYFVDKTEVQQFYLRIFGISVATLPVLSLIFLVYFAISYSRKAKYAEISSNLHEVQHAIRDAHNKIREKLISQLHPQNTGTSSSPNNKIEDIKAIAKHDLIAILSQVVAIFTITSSVNCRASIKLIGKIKDDAGAKDSGGIDNLCVLTLARDNTSGHQCSKKDEEEEKNRGNHSVQENTDYTLLIQGKLRYFFSGDISGYQNYLNSSKDYWERHRPLNMWIGNKLPFLRSHTIGSVYPYASVMTLPIRKEHSEAPLGFLCIDSMSKNCFNERYDIHLAASISDSIAHLLYDISILVQKMKSHTTE